MIDIYIRETEGDLSAVSHGLLREVLSSSYGIDAPDFFYGEKGKPYLKDGPCFSISHSHGFVAVAFSQQEIGLDIEVVRTFHEKLPKRIFSGEEYDWFLRRNQTKVDFFTLWTLKESYYKYLGTGLPMFPDGTVFYKTTRWNLKNSPLFFSVIEEKKLLISICGNEQQEIMIHRV